MTKEDAIKTLKELWRETNDTWYEEVYKMAINALEADRKTEPKTDCNKLINEVVKLDMSREDKFKVMELLERHCEKCKHYLFTDVDGYYCEHETYGQPCGYEPKDEPTISKMEQVDEPQIGEMMTEEEFDSMLARVLTGEDEPQTDDFFRNPTAEERKAVADYIDSISVPTGVNVFDLIDELQMERGE